MSKTLLDNDIDEDLVTTIKDSFDYTREATV